MSKEILTPDQSLYHISIYLSSGVIKGLIKYYQLESLQDAFGELDDDLDGKLNLRHGITLVDPKNKSEALGKFVLLHLGKIEAIESHPYEEE